MRGEKAHRRRKLHRGAGSPPLARGKDPRHPHIASIKGITPACAGKSLSTHQNGACSKDHPRLRGEKLIVCPTVAPVRGSPPLARGKDLKDVKAGRSSRITPACAGKRVSILAECPTMEDHPRLRGEKLWLIPLFLSSLGSPPLARGKGGAFMTSDAILGITPACAGKSGADG